MHNKIEQLVSEAYHAVHSHHPRRQKVWDWSLSRHTSFAGRTLIDIVPGHDMDRNAEYSFAHGVGEYIAVDLHGRLDILHKIKLQAYFEKKYPGIALTLTLSDPLKYLSTRDASSAVVAVSGIDARFLGDGQLQRQYLVELARQINRVSSGLVCGHSSLPPLMKRELLLKHEPTMYPLVVHAPIKTPPARPEHAHYSAVNL